MQIITTIVVVLRVHGNRENLHMVKTTPRWYFFVTFVAVTLNAHPPPFLSPNTKNRRCLFPFARSKKNNTPSSLLEAPTRLLATHHRRCSCPINHTSPKNTWCKMSSNCRLFKVVLAPRSHYATRSTFEKQHYLILQSYTTAVLFVCMSDFTKIKNGQQQQQQQ